VTRLIRYDHGTLVLEGFPENEVPSGFQLDARIGLPRGLAIHYHRLILDLHRRQVAYEDQARAYTPLERPHLCDRTPRDYQREALAAWLEQGRRGIVVLPTGSGKSFVAELCIAKANRSALVIAPTIDLVGQWYDSLTRAFPGKVGILGGGVHEVAPLTVSTYDSAYIHSERYGAHFGLLIFDEVHHLPGHAYRLAAENSLAPFRLALTATLERTDGGHSEIERLVGPVVYRREITELAGEFLADYQTEYLEVHLSTEDHQAYEQARGTFRQFANSRGIRLGGAGGWQHFLREAARSSEGRRAFRAWQESRRIMQGAPAKMRLLEELLRRHHQDRIIVFTNDNATVYDISRRLLLPAITHQTDLTERKKLLTAFKNGALRTMVTSRVLNEGVDIPSANVAIVLSGTGTVREHVQRLGRILRKAEGKRAVLYEVVVAETAEEQTSRSRRKHIAYGKDVPSGQ
jgi:superfamily II DNA or RNA helicase